MPELPDLEYIVRKLSPLLSGRTIESVTIKEPILFRIMVPGTVQDLLPGQEFVSAERYGPFLVLSITSLTLVVHFMLSGVIQYAKEGDKDLPYLSFSLALDNGDRLNFGDRKKMAKVYVSDPGKLGVIPGFADQGVDILGKDFTLNWFFNLIQGKRQQVRVFLMDQTLLSAIGNAYADEILYDAGIHPKTLCSQLDDEEKEKLYNSIRTVIAWGIREVEEADKGMEKKFRDHVKVRNRKGEQCGRCGSTIRRVQVYGYDSFFCPACQPPKNRPAIPWDR